MSRSKDQLINTIVAHIDAGKLDDGLEVIKTAAAQRQQLVRARTGIRVKLRVDPHMRPAYLSGCEGTLGNARGRRWEFFPDPGSRAAQRSRGGAWKINLTSFDEASQKLIQHVIVRGDHGG